VRSIKTLLFLCTGNYYRSRFSEEYFNYYAEKHGLEWCADSKGIQRDFSGNGNIGPMSSHTIDKLAELQIPARGAERMPAHVYEPDFSDFDRIIAVSLDEHKSMLEALWPAHTLAKVEYFDVEDLHIEGSDTALPRLIRHLDKLINGMVSNR
jgi:protein-tyrosine phosphatase